MSTLSSLLEILPETWLNEKGIPTPKHTLLSEAHVISKVPFDSKSAFFVYFSCSDDTDNDSITCMMLLHHNLAC
jgi:hypothetical protein